MNDPRDSLSGFSVPMIADTLLGGQPGSRFSASQKLARFLSRHGSSRGRGSDRRGRSVYSPTDSPTNSPGEPFKEDDYAAAYNQSQCFGRDHQDWSARD